jgi:small conductance mechanosensitive channel
MTFSVSYGDDIRLAKEIISRVLAEEERILSEPAPDVAVGELAASSVNFVVRPWVKSEDYWAVKFSVNEKIKLAFDENKITIPFPQMNINVTQ